MLNVAVIPAALARSLDGAAIILIKPGQRRCEDRKLRRWQRMKYNVRRNHLNFFLKGHVRLLYPRQLRGRSAGGSIAARRCRRCWNTFTRRLGTEWRAAECVNLKIAPGSYSCPQQQPGVYMQAAPAVFGDDPSFNFWIPELQACQTLSALRSEPCNQPLTLKKVLWMLYQLENPKPGLL